MKNILLLSGKKVYITSTQAPPPDFVGSPLPEGASWSGRLPDKPKSAFPHTKTGQATPIPYSYPTSYMILSAFFPSAARTFCILHSAFLIPPIHQLPHGDEAVAPLQERGDHHAEGLGGGAVMTNKIVHEDDIPRLHGIQNMAADFADLQRRRFRW